MTITDEAFVEVFIQESREHLDVLEPSLLALEGNSTSKDLINAIFRAVHSLKGSAGFLGLDAIATLSHAMENMMSLVRDGKLILNKEHIDTLLAGTDKLKLMLESPFDSAKIDAKSIKEAITAFLTENPKTKEPCATEKPAVVRIGTMHPNPTLIQHAIENHNGIFSVQVFIKKDIKDKGRMPLDCFSEAERFGEIIDCATDFSNIAGLDDVFSFDPHCQFIFAAPVERDIVALAFDVSQEQVQKLDPMTLKPLSTVVEDTKSAPAATCTHEVAPQLKPQPQVQPQSTNTANMESANKTEKLATPEQHEKASGAEPVKSSVTHHDDTIRVSVSLLDSLMNLVGELVLGRNQLVRHTNAFATITEELVHNVDRTKYSGNDYKRVNDKVVAQNSNLLSTVQSLSMVTTELQSKVMLTRLQPIGSLFGKFPRVVRDLANKLGKEMTLEMIGEEVELDKSILETLSDPLTHLIRNCADHAIEMPNDRVQAQKPRIGKIRLSAKHVGGQVHIEISDDGRGIDPEMVKHKALEKGIVTHEAASQMSRSQLINLIFLPGFSTVKVVTDVSGRGVGMDVVKTNIENLGGTVEIDSTPGVGTRICLKLPLTLAIIPALIVEIASRIFAVPQINLVEIVEINESHHVEHVGETRVLRLREELLPLVNMGAVLFDENFDHKALPKYVLVLRVDEHRYGLLTDKLHDGEEIVVKPISVYLKNAACYSGETIMGDGSVAMILDASGIASRAKLDFASIKKVAQERVDKQQDEISTTERQSFLIFRNHEEERFAINLSLISRIEEVQDQDIQEVGDKEYLNYHGQPLRLIRLHDFMSVQKNATKPSSLSVIIPKLVAQPMGIVATRIDDVINSTLTMDTENLTGTGILGSTVLDDNIVIILDIYSLFEKVDPDTYQWQKERGLFANRRILLAEDTPFFRAVETQYLSELFDHVDISKNGTDAWQKINQEKYDLLITDIEMPGMNGFELAERIKKSNEHNKLPIIALTAMTSKPVKDRCIDIGIDAFEAKLDKEKLRNTITSVLQKYYGTV